MIQFFTGGITNTTPSGEVTIGQLFLDIMSPNQELKSLLKNIQQAAAMENDQLKHDLKKQLPYYIPAAQVKKRSYENIIQFTGFMPVDFDKLKSEDAVALKYDLMQHPFVIAAWLSSSRKGVRAIIHVPICRSVEEYKKRFFALEDEFSIYSGFDIMLQSPIQAMYYSMDDDILMNSNFTTFTKIKEEKLPIVRENYKKTEYINDSEKFVYNVIKSKIDTIQNEGHPILRAAAFTLGGYVGSNYIQKSDAIDMIDTLIENNLYLNKKPSAYKKTARQMIEKGALQPITLNK